MKFTYKTAGKKLRFRFVIGTSLTGKVPMRIRVYNASNLSAVYMNANVPLNDTVLPEGKRNPREVFVQLPKTPERVVIEIYNKRNGNLAEGADPSFKLMEREALPLDQYKDCITGWGNVWDFIKFAQNFSEEAGFASATLSPGFPQGEPSSYCYYYAPGEAFQIDYYDDIKGTSEFKYDSQTKKVLTDQFGAKIKDETYGKVMATPARIHEKTGIIEVSKRQMLRYTVPMRMAILLHEYSHVYRNRNKRSETEADINALKIYLGLGYPVYEARQAFLKVFIGTPSDGNVERYHAIEDFINQWEKSHKC